MSTRSKKKLSSADTKASQVIQKRVENSWILLAKGIYVKQLISYNLRIIVLEVVNNIFLYITESLLNNSSFSIITLPHPAHGGPAKYCLDDANHKIYEIVTFKEPYRSWFIEDSVKSDGSLLMTTPIDPLFLGKTNQSNILTYQHFNGTNYDCNFGTLNISKMQTPWSQVTVPCN